MYLRKFVTSNMPLIEFAEFIKRNQCAVSMIMKAISFHIYKMLEAENVPGFFIITGHISAAKTQCAEPHMQSLFR